MDPFLLYVLVIYVISCCQSCPPVRHLSPAHLQVESPGFGPLKTYPPNSNCQWDITLPTGKEAKFTFFAFDLEDVPGCARDGVEIFRGNCKNRGKSVLRACGINSPSTLTLEGAVCVTFWSDDIGHKRGFQLSVFMDDNHIEPTVNCTFDGFSMCGYQDNSPGPLSWRRRDASFPVSGLTNTKGFYLYVDGPFVRTDLTAELRFPESGTSDQSCLQFTYAVSHTRDKGQELRVEGDVGHKGGADHAFWSVTGGFQQDWKNATISLPAGVKDLRLIFKTDSFSPSLDLVAVDDIEQTEGRCPGSVLDCNMNRYQADTCQYSLQQNKTDTPFVEEGVHLHTPASMKSPLFNSSVSICFTFMAKVIVKSAYFKVSYLNQLNGRSFHGDTLATRQLGGRGEPIWCTFSVDIPGSPYPRQLVLEFYSDAGPGAAVMVYLRSYDGNCLTKEYLFGFCGQH